MSEGTSGPGQTPVPGWVPRRPQARRRVFVLAGLLGLPIGAAVMLIAVLMPGAALDVAPLAVRAGAPVTLPDLGLRSREVFVAAPAAAEGTRDEDYGCQVQGPGGERLPASTVSFATWKRTTVQGQDFRTALTVYGYPAGSRLTCTGPATRRFEPLYVVSTATTSPGDRLFVAFGGVLCLLMSAFLLLVFGRRRR